MSTKDKNHVKSDLARYYHKNKYLQNLIFLTNKLLETKFYNHLFKSTTTQD